MYGLTVGVAGLGRVNVEGVVDLDCTAELEGEDGEGGHLRIRENLGRVLKRVRRLEETGEDG